jgi:hypothetical protein
MYAPRLAPANSVTLAPAPQPLLAYNRWPQSESVTLSPQGIVPPSSLQRALPQGPVPIPPVVNHHCTTTRAKFR